MHFLKVLEQSQSGRRLTALLTAAVVLVASFSYTVPAAAAYVDENGNPVSSTETSSSSSSSSSGSSSSKTTTGIPSKKGITVEYTSSGAIDESSLSACRYKSEEQFINMIGPIARTVGLKYKYLPSVLAAQCCLETGYGGVYDKNTASMVYYNNMLGMKSSLINSTWGSHSVWTGKSYVKRTPEYYNGVNVHINDSFRAYSSVKQCLTDYVMFMTWAKLGNGKYKYRHDVIKNKSYKKTIRAVSQNGYATDPAYANSVIRIIEKWNLTKLDKGFLVKVKSVSLNKKKLTLKRKKTYKLKLTVKPANAANKKVRWVSTNKKVVTVSSNGKVKALKKGTAYVMAISLENSNKYARVRVRVK